MRPARKADQWHFGMKAYVGVDSKTKPIHAVDGHGGQVPADLPHGDETRAWGGPVALRRLRRF